MRFIDDKGTCKGPRAYMKGVESYVTCINEILPENNVLFWQISTEIVHILVVWRSRDFG